MVPILWFIVMSRVSLFCLSFTFFLSEPMGPIWVGHVSFPAVVGCVLAGIGVGIGVGIGACH